MLLELIVGTVMSAVSHQNSTEMLFFLWCVSILATTWVVSVQVTKKITINFSSKPSTNHKNIMRPNSYSRMWCGWLDTGKIKELPSTTNNLVKNVVAARSVQTMERPNWTWTCHTNSLRLQRRVIRRGGLRITENHPSPSISNYPGSNS